LLALVIAFIQW